MTNTLLLAEGEGKDRHPQEQEDYVLPTPSLDHTQYTATCV